MKRYFLCFVFIIFFSIFSFSKSLKVNIIQPDGIEPFISGFDIRDFGEYYLLIIYEKNNKVYKLDNNFKVIEKYSFNNGEGPCEGIYFKPLYSVNNFDVFYNDQKSNFSFVKKGKCKKLKKLIKKDFRNVVSCDYNKDFFICSTSKYIKKSKRRDIVILKYLENEKAFSNESIIFNIKKKNILHTPPELGFVQDNIFFFDRNDFTDSFFNIKVINIKGELLKQINIPYTKKKTLSKINETKSIYKNVCKATGVNLDKFENEWGKKYINGFCSNGSQILFAEISENNEKISTYLHFVNTLDSSEKVLTVKNKFIPKILSKNKIIGFYQEDEDFLLSIINLN